MSVSWAQGDSGSGLPGQAAGAACPWAAGSRLRLAWPRVLRDRGPRAGCGRCFVRVTRVLGVCCPVSPASLPSGPQQHLLPTCNRLPTRSALVSPCSCPCVCHLCVAPSPLGAQPPSHGEGLLVTLWLLEHSRRQRLGGTAALTRPPHEALLCRPQRASTCARVCACVWRVMCLYLLHAVHQGWLCFWAKGPTCPGAPSPACHFPRRDLSPGQPLENFRLDPRARVVCSSRGPAATTRPIAVGGLVKGLLLPRAGSEQVAVGCHANVQTCVSCCCCAVLWSGTLGPETAGVAGPSPSRSADFVPLPGPARACSGPASQETRW